MTDIRKQMSIYGQRLKDMRSARKLSLSDVHSITGISRTHLSEVENGKKDTNLPMLMKLEKAYGESVRHVVIMGDEDKVDK